MSDAPADGPETPEALHTAYEILRLRYEAPALVVVIAFMLWVRLQQASRFVAGEKVYFSGNDAYYHFREVNYVVRHWPFTMPFDPWTFFPYGTETGQFGTLFDQLIATAALIVGLGSPSEMMVAEVVLVAPAVFGALVAIPTYFIARRLAGRRAGVVAAVVLALLPGTFLRRGLVGFADHNIAEVLFQGTAVLAVMVAVAVAEREQPVYELVIDRDWDALRRPVSYGLAAGVALFLYVWLWPPAVVLVGLLGVFFVLAIPLHVYRGRSPEPLAVVGVVSMGSLTVLQILAVDTLSFATTQVSPLQILLAAGVGFGCLYMAWLARAWDRRTIDPRGYPLAVWGTVAVGILALAVLLPQVYDLLVRNVLRTFAFGQTDTTLTIGEAQSVPIGQLGGFLFQQYGLTFLTAVVGVLGLAYPVVVRRNYRAEHLFVIVWAVATTLMAFTQVRFNYYLAVAVAVLTAWTVEQFLHVIELPSTPRDLEVYQVLSLIVAVVLVIAPLLPPIAAGHVVAVGQANSPGNVVTWTKSLDWIEENTPEEGRYGGVSNELAYYGTFERTDDHAYPEGAYGVMSWWDYGHWITVEGERIPNANPFQQGPRVASAFLLAENETRANLILEALPSNDIRGQIPTMSVQELRATVEAQSAQQAAEDTRYVVIDDQMAAGKFSAIATWTGPGPQLYFSRQEFQVGETTAHLVGPNDAYHETMLAKLYYQDARGLSHYRLVHETERESIIVSIAGQTAGGGYSETNFINRRLNQQVFTTVQQRPDLAFYAVQQDSSGTNPSRVKTYERVPGATLAGQVNTSEPAVVWATLQLQTNTGRNFTYIQQVRTDAQGNVELTVPYATTNTVGPAEGGTDTAVVAKGDYELFVNNPFQPSATATVAVPEPAIYEGESIAVEFEPAEGNQTVTINASDDSSSSSLANPSRLDNADRLVDHTPTGGHTSRLAVAPRRLLDA